MTTERPDEAKPEDIAVTVAKRMYGIFREESPDRIPAWNGLGPERRTAWVRMAARLMLEAQAQREEWTRSYIEHEKTRLMREFTGPQPGRYRGLPGGWPPTGSDDKY